ncbi:hypothetical protein Sjap_009360 [Stephania japonica]|uniref:Disease resistance protein n=1 Tax=Stephania japonica TaxID=461633 RepID=A0AAP0JRW9_9MAGN
MAGEVVVSVVDKLAKLLMQEASLLSGVHRDVEQVQEELRQIQSFLQDADNEQAANENAKNWILDVTDIAYDAENVIDTFILKEEKKRRRTFAKRYACIFTDLIFRRKIQNEIERIKTRIRLVLDRRITYGIQSIGEGPGSSSQALAEQRQSSPHFNELGIVGFHHDVSELEELLMNNNPELQFISIVGMGGCGKTALAKSIYNSDNIKRHFSCRVWVFVSQNYGTEELREDMEKQVKRSFEVTNSRIAGYNNLYDLLELRRWLIVMDDIWTPRDWDRLRHLFPYTHTGSRILITTRRRDAVPRCHIHELEPLNALDSWNLFVNRTFGEGTECPEHLEEVADLIVNKCGGLPLAIVVIAGLLSAKGTSITTWSRVLDSLKWHLNQESGQCSAILALSYYDLPFYLKSCFLYFGLFPAGFLIPVRRLIRLWMAEGFVHVRDLETPEDVATDYIQELVDRNLIQIVKKDAIEVDKKGKKAVITRVDQGELNWRSATCRTHELIRDLALLMGRNTQFQGNVGEKTRRVAVHTDVDVWPRSNFDYHGSRIRSILLFVLREEFSYTRIMKKRFKFLRVLDLEGTYISIMPNALGKLIHLRYLGLRRTWLTTLPSSVGKLFNLQTLDLKHTRINSFSTSIWRLKQLRHLYLNWNCMVLKRVNGPRENLQTLWGIGVAKESFVRGRLDQLTNLRKLGVEIRGNLSSQGEALAEWIYQSTRLEHLNLSSQAREAPHLTLHRHVHLVKLRLEGKLPNHTLFDRDHFPPCLTTLTLIVSFLRIDPMVTLANLPNLRVLRLWCNSYMGRSMTCISNGFAKLEVLEICDLDTLEEWQVEEGSMSNLQELQIINCKELRMLPTGLAHLRNIKELRLAAMSISLRERLMPNIGEDWYKIQHIPFIVPPLLEEELLPPEMEYEHSGPLEPGSPLSPRL